MSHLIVFENINRAKTTLATRDIEAIQEVSDPSETPTKIIMKSGQVYFVRDHPNRAYVMLEDALKRIAIEGSIL